MTSVQNNSATGMTGQTKTDDSKTTPTIGADFNMFLKLLTAQMQNQDPLDPMDTSEYTQQLVQYSQVEQSMQQTAKLDDIVAKLSGQDMAQASSFIGREARFDSPVSGLDDTGPASWTYYIDGQPQSVVMTVKDASGKVVHEESVGMDAQGRYAWDGKLASGERAAPGAYTLSIKAVAANAADLKTTINSVAIVKDVVTDGQTVMLGVNGIRMPVSGLVAIAEPA